MNPIVMFLVKLLVSSGLMLAFYFALFRGKASFRASRVFLVAIPLLGLLFSLVSVEGGRGYSFASVTAPALRATPPEVEGLQPVIGSSGVVAVEASVPVMETAAVPVDVDRSEVVEVSGGGFPGVAVVYILPVAIFVAIIAWQMAALGRIRRRARRQMAGSCTVYFSHDVRNAFSVMRSIYVSEDAADEKLAIIIRHEAQHIARRHYVDLAVMELLTVAMWFNPVVWIARRELRSVHEFEADRGTLDAGVGMRDYMLAILQEAVGAIPVMANGLKSSMIKKRFQKMKTENKIRLRGLRATLTIPFAIALAMFFALEPAAGVELGSESSFVAPEVTDLPVAAQEMPPVPVVEPAVVEPAVAEPAIVESEVHVAPAEVIAGNLYFPDTIFDNVAVEAIGTIRQQQETPRQDEPRNIRVMARDRKGRPVNSQGVRVGKSGDDQMYTLDSQGRLTIEGITDNDALVVLAGDNIYEFSVEGLDSLQVIFRNRNRIDINSTRKAINEEINIGYGTISKRNNTGSVGTVDMSDADNGYTDLKSYIQGRIAGVTFIGDELIIRGISSLMASNEALVVVDGAMMTNFEQVNNTIHPSNVASITVLKDASSNAIYGSRAANGVMLITTKTRIK